MHGDGGGRCKALVGVGHIDGFEGARLGTVASVPGGWKGRFCDCEQEGEGKHEKKGFGEHVGRRRNGIVWRGRQDRGGLERVRLGDGSLSRS